MASSWSTRTSSEAVSARCRRPTSRLASTPRTSSGRSTSCEPGMACTTVRSRTAAATRAWATTTPSSSRCVYESPNATSPNRLADGSLAGLDARDRIVLDPVNVNANGLTLRGVEFDYKTPRYHNYNVTLQTDVVAESLHRDRIRRHAGSQPRDVHRHEQRERAAAAGHRRGTRTWTGRISRWDRCSCGPSA